MRKTELSPEQLAQRETIIQQLADASWVGHPMNDFFEQGVWVDYEAIMDYTNTQARFSLLYDAEDSKLELLVDEAWRYIFVIEFGAHLEQVLEILIALQDRLAFKTLTEVLHAILDVCPTGLYIYDDDMRSVSIDEKVLAELRVEVEELLS
jgi:hypothetical protein